MNHAVRILVSVVLLAASGLHGQIYTILHNFPAFSRDGYAPLTDLVLDTNTGVFYGATVSAGTNGNGTIFRINTDGTGYHIIRSMTDGAPERGGMLLLSNTLYGTTYAGGSNNNGSIFKMNTDGSGWAVLHNFSATAPSTFGTNYDGNRVMGKIVTDGNAIYGTAEYGGTNNTGTVFKINTDGSGFTVLKTFSATYAGTNNAGLNFMSGAGTNMDGARPVGGLVLSGTTLYGATYHGGTSNGVVFAMQTDGSGFTVLKYFPTISGIGTNSDGAAAVAGLVLGGDLLYGATVGGGVLGCGNIFRIKTNGTDFTDLHDFLHADGAFPGITLMLNGSTIYGTTAAGGLSNRGTIFMLQTNGADFVTLMNLDLIRGTQCDSKFVLVSNVLFGTMANGGTGYNGVVFGLTILPQILTSDEKFGIISNEFGFNVTGISNQTVIVESSADPALSLWQPLQTNVLTGAPFYFCDPAWGQNANCFYRLRTP